MTPWLTTLTTLQMRRPRGCRRGGGTLPLGGRGILHLGPGPCTRHAPSRGRLQADVHPAIHRPAPTAAPATLAAYPRHGHRRSRGGGRQATQSTTITTNTTQTRATGWRHGQWHCATPHTVTTPGTLPTLTHLPLLHPLPTWQWGCNWGRRHVHSPTPCSLLPCTPPRWCNRKRGHWLGHHTTNVTVTATATVAVTTHTSTPTTRSRPTPRHLSRRWQWRRRGRHPTPTVPMQRLCSTILHLWWAATWAPHRAWRRTAPRRCLLPRLDLARDIHLGIHTCWFAGQPRSRQLPQRSGSAATGVPLPILTSLLRLCTPHPCTRYHRQPRAPPATLGCHPWLLHRRSDHTLLTGHLLLHSVHDVLEQPTGDVQQLPPQVQSAGQPTDHLTSWQAQGRPHHIPPSTLRSQPAPDLSHRHLRP